MMKSILRGTAAVVVIASMGGVAQAQTHTNGKVQYANTIIGASGNADTPLNLGEVLVIAANELAIANGIGTRLATTATSPNDTETATRSVSSTFTLTGSVNKDCSFYAGNNAAGRTIDFGVIGVKTGDNENVNAAFEMAGGLSANINTLTAGCNFNNEVVITKRDGSDYSGMNLVGNPGGFDVTQFQTNIPYEVTATWQGVALNDVTQGSPQSLTVTTGQATATKQQGAWRSAMNIAISAPAVTNRGLVAGTYQDTLTIRLSAL
jgi:hypothetical protein